MLIVLKFRFQSDLIIKIDSLIRFKTFTPYQFDKAK